MTTLYANPYNSEFTGFFFSSTDEYEDFLAHAKGTQNEDFEHEIDFIDGESQELFNALNGYFSDWLDAYFEYSGDAYYTITGIIFLRGVGFNAEDKESLGYKLMDLSIIDSDVLDDYLLESLNLPEDFNTSYIELDYVRSEYKNGGSLVECNGMYITNADCI